MPAGFLSYDDANMWTKAVGNGGATSAQWKALQPKLREAHARVESHRSSGAQGFFDLPFASTAKLETLARSVQKQFRHLIVIGIGGSDLGARAIWQALPGEKMRLHFVSNPDPDSLAAWRELTRADWKKTAILVVSKSGTTLETMAAFMVLRDWLIAAVGERAHARQVFVLTEEGHGTLFALAERYGYQVIPHPTNVGGRFSVLSTVGLFPSACGGVSVKRLLSGARSVEAARRREGIRHAAVRFAGLHYLAMRHQGKPLHVLMPYADRLSSVAFWYRQLWAESLGKRRGGTSVGPTPIAALGAVDQHSQIQLYNEGPADKIVTFLEVEKFSHAVRVPRLWGDVKGVEYVGGLSLQHILHAEREGTAQALAENGRPNGTIRLPSVSPESIGALFMFYELATAYMGELLGVNTYDQPGVEAGKKIARTILET